MDRAFGDKIKIPRFEHDRLVINDEWYLPFNHHQQFIKVGMRLIRDARTAHLYEFNVGAPTLPRISDCQISGKSNAIFAKEPVFTALPS